MRQGFAKHFQNLNLARARANKHGHVELKDMYHEGLKFEIDFKNRSRKTTKWK